MLTKGLAFLYDPFVTAFGVGVSLHKKTLTASHITRDERILDIGCGTGTFVLLVKKTYPDSNVVGLDPDEEVLQIAKSKAQKSNSDITFVQASAENLPFQDSSFDIIVSSLAFHHLPTAIKKQALQEICRVLKPRGRFLLVDIGKPKNLFWRVILYIESLIEPKTYIKDNLKGKIPSFLKETHFIVNEARPTYLGIQFLLARKE